jgi:hypothetical protein
MMHFRRHWRVGGFLIWLALAASVPGRAAISFDAGTYKNNNAGALSVSFQHTCTGTQGILVFSITLVTTTAGVAQASYGGVPLALARSDAETTNVKAETWYLANPPTGANTLSITLTAATVGEMGCLSLNGVDTASPLGTAGAVALATSAPSLSLATQFNNSWLVGILAQQGAHSSVPGTGINIQWGPLYTAECGATGFTMPTTAAGIYSPGFSISSPSSVVLQAVEIKAALSPGPTPTPAPAADTAAPNPFTPDQASNNLVLFSLPSSHEAGSLVLVDLKRRAARKIEFGAGSQVAWDGKNDKGEMVHGGVYVYVLRAGDLTRKGTVTVLR